ncbi:zinc finger protein 276 isoform X2 [Amia ocellicauda]|uniref:zinc finger protein 276 isoform X2 n=1 Tax=Amia ocellicauda TaxID=2972642 RepID=UPI0034640ADE
MKRDRRGRPVAASQQTRTGQPAAGSKRPGRRGRPRSAARKDVSGDRSEGSCSGPEESCAGGQQSRDGLAASDVGVGGAEGGSEQSGSGRLSTAFCRLCHGKFSPRSLRHAFGKLPAELGRGPGVDRRPRTPQLFFADFQRLVGVPVTQDPLLSQFVCKNCHNQFYKCHSILRTFVQRVNLSPSVKAKAKNSGNSVSSHSTVETSAINQVITSSPQCLYSLVSWTHQHAGGCQSCPGLREVLAGEYCGAVRAVWSCVDGHRYIMDTASDRTSVTLDLATEPVSLGERAEGTGKPASANPVPEHGPPPLNTSTGPRGNSNSQPAGPVAAPHTQDIPVHHPQSDKSTPETACLNSTAGQLGSEKPIAVPAEPLDGVEDSDLSDRESLSEDEDEDKGKSGSSDELFEPYPEKKMSPKKNESKEAKKKMEPKVRKKPGPKPGWKKKIKTEREELPTIYKCPHQGCIAVYRGADGMKKHIKEHHEEVRERPCPHPGCNKVFMIDRYLQRHVKLIHTEVRNYICDQCGQTFKQRKHLSVHQMRHSGAKPLQCEVCGFQCRQRASLKYHMTKHKAEAELEFACDMCGKRFEKAHNLNVHMSMVHPLTQNTDKSKAYREPIGFVPSQNPPVLETISDSLAQSLIQTNTS